MVKTFIVQEPQFVFNLTLNLCKIRRLFNIFWCKVLITKAFEYQVEQNNKKLEIA